MPISLYIKIFGVLAIVAAIGGSVLYVRNLQVENGELKTEVNELTLQVENEQKKNKQLKLDYESIKLQHKKFQKSNTALQNQYSSLESKFNKLRADGTKRDFGALAKSKPGLVQKIINKATVEANRCLEIASGSPVIPDEKNSLCQELIDLNK